MQDIVLANRVPVKVSLARTVYVTAQVGTPEIPSSLVMAAVLVQPTPHQLEIPLLDLLLRDAPTTTRDVKNGLIEGSAPLIPAI